MPPRYGAEPVLSERSESKGRLLGVTVRGLLGVTVRGLLGVTVRGLLGVTVRGYQAWNLTRKSIVPATARQSRVAGAYSAFFAI